MMHTCPTCGNPCGCEEEQLYGDCVHACGEWKAETDHPQTPTGNTEPDDYDFGRETP
jgi:hypothetical protein